MYPEILTDYHFLYSVFRYWVEIVWHIYKRTSLIQTRIRTVVQWSYASWIYNYLCNFFPGIPVSSFNETDRHNVTEILLEVALNTITLTRNLSNSNTLANLQHKNKLKMYIQVLMKRKLNSDGLNCTKFNKTINFDLWSVNT